MASPKNYASTIQPNTISLNKTYSVSKRRNRKSNVSEASVKDTQSNFAIADLTTNQYMIDNSHLTKQLVTSSPSTQNFSSRNSLRTSQSFATREAYLTPPTMAVMPEHYVNDDIQLARGVETDLSYHRLNVDSDCFNLMIKGNKICMLCRRKHGTAGDHARMFLKLRDALHDSSPRRDSIHMHIIKKLILKWYDKIYLNDRLIKERVDIAQTFDSILSTVNPECSTRLVGSLTTGTSLVSSNINLELVHPNSKLFESNVRAKNSIHHVLINSDAELGAQFNNHTIHYDLIPNPMETLYKLWILICEKNETTSNCPFKVISKLQDLFATVPKLNLLHQDSGIELEINCYGHSSLKLSSLIRTYLSLDQRAQILSVLVKYWAKCCKINTPDKGTLPPYVFVILVIYFLQRTSPPILPCLHDIFHKETRVSKVRYNDNSIPKALKLNGQLTTDDNFGPKKQNNINHPNHQQDTNIEMNEDEDVDVDDSAEKEEEEDDFYIDEKNENVRNLIWSSSNNTPIHELFIEFLRFTFYELECTQRTLTLRSLKKASNKRNNPPMKVIENPVKPSVNLARSIGNYQNYQYLIQCFKHSFYYLTSIPVDLHLKPIEKFRNNPEEYIELYYNIKNLKPHLKLMEQASWQEFNDSETLTFILQESNLLFARDVEVVNAIFNRLQSVSSVDIQEILTDFMTSCYKEISLKPKDYGMSIFCWLCKTTGHIKSDCPKGKIERLDYEYTTYKFDLDFESNLDKYFLNNYHNNRITSEDSFMYKKIVEELTRMINSATGIKCHLELYGSTVNNLGSYNSDLDICMTLEGNPSGKGVDCVDVLTRVYNKVLTKRAFSQIHSLEPILSARVPIIKFKYSKFKRDFDIDLSMYNQCATYNSKLLKMYSLIDERLPQLFFLVKRYAKASQIADASKGSLSSYAWSIMVVHYLQHTNPPILPVLQEKEANHPVIGINGWNVWFDDDLDSVFQKKTQNLLNLTQLFKGFFLYYGTFDFDINIISIRKFNPISRFQKSWNSCLMAIEDPFELTYNLASRLDDPMAIYILNSFAQAFRHIEKVQESYRQSKNGANIIRDIFDGNAITKTTKPPFRGCRICHKIGHKVKDCPESRQGNFSRRRV